MDATLIAHESDRQPTRITAGIKSRAVAQDTTFGGDADDPDDHSCS
jgi:hypothetical protein